MQDSEGRAPIHVAISNQHSVIIQLLISHPEIRLNIRDRQGMTPFACAMTHKNNKAAEAILKREAGAAEQVSLHIQTIVRMLLSKSKTFGRSTPFICKIRCVPDPHSFCCC